MDVWLNLAPLLSASPAIRIHAFAAIAALVIGILQFAGPKGTGAHRLVGMVWVVLMAIVALSSFWIHKLKVFGLWSPIHLVSIAVLIVLPLGVVLAHRRNTRAHARTMTGVFIGGLVVAGLLALRPGRIMHAVVFGPVTSP